MKKFKAVVAIALTLSAASAYSETITKRVVKQGSMVCDSRSEMEAAMRAIMDENYALPTRLVEKGKCTLIHQDRKFDVVDFDPSDNIQAVIFPSGKWGRVPTFSIR